MEFQLLMSLGTLVHANIKKVPSPVTLCSNASFACRTLLYHLFERFDISQRSLVLNEYSAQEHEVNVPKAA